MNPRFVIIRDAQKVEIVLRNGAQERVGLFDLEVGFDDGRVAGDDFLFFCFALEDAVNDFVYFRRCLRRECAGSSNNLRIWSFAAESGLSRRCDAMGS